MTTLQALGLPDADAIMAAGRALAESYAGEAKEKTAAGVPFLMVTPEATLSRPELFAWGLQDRLLDIVEAYLGLAPAYDGMTILYTAAGCREEATRLWHRDREDRRMVKIAIYLNDVDADGGPFEILPPDVSVAESSATDIMSCEGRAGTVIFADTARCLHRGKPANNRDRTAIFYSYFAARPRRPYFCHRSGLTHEQIEQLSAGLPPRQLASALWFKRLPGLLRLMPSAPI